MKHFGNNIISDCVVKPLTVILLVPLQVRVHGRRSLWKVSPGDVDQLPGLEVGDLVDQAMTWE